MTRLTIITKRKSKFGQFLNKIKNMKNNFHKNKVINGITYYEKAPKKINGLETYF